MAKLDPNAGQVVVEKGDGMIARTVSDVIKVGGVWINLCPHGYTIDCCNSPECEVIAEPATITRSACGAEHCTGVACLRDDKHKHAHIGRFGAVLVWWHYNDGALGLQDERGGHPIFEWPITMESSNRNEWEDAMIAACLGHPVGSGIIAELALKEAHSPAELASNIAMRLTWREVNAETDVFHRVKWKTGSSVQTIECQDPLSITGDTTEAARHVMVELLRLPREEPRETIVKMLRNARSRTDSEPTRLMRAVMK